MEATRPPLFGTASGELSKWGLTQDSSIYDYWEQAAIRCESEEQQAACRKMAKLFEEFYRTTTIAMMGHLYHHQVEEILPLGGGKPGWTSSIEYNCGFSFRRMNGSADSAALVATRQQEVKMSMPDNSSKYDTKGDPSLGYLITKRGGVQLPESVKRAATDTEHPRKGCAARASTPQPHTAAARRSRTPQPYASAARRSRTPQPHTAAAHSPQPPTGGTGLASVGRVWCVVRCVSVPIAQPTSPQGDHSQ